MRETYTYDTNGNESTNIGEIWQFNNWTNLYRYTYFYDSIGNRLTKLFEWYNNAWILSERDTYIYTANGNILSNLNEQWNSQNNIWLKIWKDTSIYDSNENALNTKAYRWNNSSWIVDSLTSSFVISVYYNNMQSQYSDNGYKIEAYYDYFNTIENVSILQASISNYPNPFNNATTITYSLSAKSNVKLSVYDITGKEVSTLVNQTQQQGTYNVNFNAANLPSGMYYYKLTTNDKMESGKMVIN